MKDLLIIPGVDYTVDWIKFLTGNWEKKYGIKTHVLSFEWDGDPDDAPEILNRTGRYLDELISQNKHVSVVGISAGGSTAINLYIPRKDKIEKVVTVWGRVRDPKVKHKSNHGPGALAIYIESTKLSEQNLKK